MRNVDQLALVIQLACLTNDRAPDEQRAMRDVARRVDRERNRITTTNPRARTVFVCTGDTWLTPAIDADDPRAIDRRQGRAIDAGKFGTIEGQHPKGCLCHGQNLLPGEGLSRLEAEVEATWEP